MHRVEVIQYFIDKNKFQSYLEIGVHKGFSFFSIKCKKKIGVDPFFQISLRFRLLNIFQILNWRNKLFQMSSDSFFRKKKNYVNGDFDIVFVDGLHTFKGSLMDVLNSLKILNENGIIVIHDCFPPNEAAATPAQSYGDAESLQPQGWNGLWCGDVWKTILYLKKQYSGVLEVHVLDTDFGLGVLKKKINCEIDLSMNEDLFTEINGLDYSYLIHDPGNLIGLRNKEYLFSI